MLRLDGGLFFATAEALDDRIRGLAEHDRPPHALVLDLEGVNFIDSQGAAKLTEIQALAESRSVTLRLARVKPHVLAVLDPKGSSTGSEPTTSTATSTEPSKRNSPTPLRRNQSRHLTVSESAPTSHGVRRYRRFAVVKSRRW